MIKWLIIGLMLLPGLQCRAEEFDLGDFPANESRRHLFTVTNSGKKPWKLGKVRSSCGCAEPRLERLELGPGESTRLTVELKPNSLDGAFAKAIYVETDDPGQRFLKFTLKGNAETLYQIEPSATLYLGTLAPGEERELRFRIRPRRGAVVFGEAVYRHSMIRKVEVIAAEKESKDLWIVIRLLPQPGDERFQVNISLPVKQPEGWPVLEFTLGGRVAKDSNQE